MVKKRSKSPAEDELDNSPAVKRRRRAIQNSDDEDDANQNGHAATPGPSDSSILDSTSNEMECSQHPDFTVQEEAEVGIVEKVVLQHFMCHKYLEMNFGSNVNFIIGRNGSGKSAIMTGLIVGLGGKATTTSRGNSLKGFIKDEHNSATVMVKLRNRGTDAYMPEQYGNTIVIERKLSRDGASAYKLKSFDGRVVSNKKEELLNILDQFNIQIDNPVSILNQDTSRCFLNSSDPGEKYKFFLKATQLEQMSFHYQMILEKQDNINITLLRKKEVLPEMEEQVKILEEKYKDIAQLKEMKERVRILKEELMWAIVRDKTSEVESAKKNVRKEENRLPKYDERIEKCKTDIRMAEQSHKAKEGAINSIVEEANELARRKTEFAITFREMKADLRKKQDSIRKKEKEIYLSEKERKQLADRIDETKQKAVRDYEAERQKTQQLLAEKEQELHMFQSQLSTSTHHRNQLEMSIKGSQERAYQMRQEETEVNRRLGNANRQLKTFRESQENRLKIFGPWVPQVVQLIKAAKAQGKFHQEPVGPLGAFIKLKDQKWNVGVEKCLGAKLMLAFCCHDLHDKEILHDIFKKAIKGQWPSIIISRFQDRVYDVSQHRAQSRYPAVLDMLEISNPVVANTLIDQGKIESVLLIEDSKEAQRVIWEERPRGAMRAYTSVGDEVIGGRSLKYYSNKKPRAYYLNASIENDIRHCQTEIEQEQVRLRQIREVLQQHDGEVRNLQQELKKARSKCNAEQQQINRLNIEIQDIASYEEEALPDVTTLEDELVLYVDKIAGLKAEVDQEKQVIDGCREALQEQQVKDNEIKAMIEDLAARMEPLREELNKVVGDIQQLKSDRKHYENKKGELMAKIGELMKIADNLQEEYQVTLDHAKDYCEEVTSERSIKGLESEISQTEKRVQSEEKNRGNAEEITKQYHDAMTKYKEICETLNSFRKFQKCLEKSAMNRYKRYDEFKKFLTARFRHNFDMTLSQRGFYGKLKFDHQAETLSIHRLDKVVLKRAAQFRTFRKYIVSRARQYFTMTLSQRGYSGKLKIDHDKETLSIHVNVEQAKGTSSKDTRSLSGGERSFSTICFIMALWEAMESPFRVLDEFDVFMDMVNRRISMDMLLKIAKEQQNRQFILLTPQDMSNISGGNNVRIYKMKDPERGQTTLPFRAENGE